MSAGMRTALEEYGATIQEHGWEAGEALIEKYSEQYRDFERWARALSIVLRTNELLEEPMT